MTDDGVAVFCIAPNRFRIESLWHTICKTRLLCLNAPPRLDALLRDLPETWTHQNEGGESFTVVDVVGHLIYADRVDWMPRARMILEHGENKPFDPFDRRGHVEECRGKNLSQLLDEFRRVRAGCLVDLRGLNLQPQRLQLRGRHPSLGPVTLSHLLATWAAHDLTHLHQISRIMADQYRDEVGPFGAFLGVLKCEGHGG